MWNSPVMRIDYSDSLKFAPLGFVHSQELDTVTGPCKYTQIFNHERVPSVATSNFFHHLARGFFEYGRSVVVQHFSREKNSRKTRGCVNYPFDSERRIISSCSCLSQQFTNRNSPSEVEDGRTSVVGQIDEKHVKRALHREGNFGLRTFQVRTYGLHKLRD
jgi:hypothetical protein